MPYHMNLHEGRMLVLLLLLGRLHWGMFRPLNNEIPAVGPVDCSKNHQPQIMLTVSSLASTLHSGQTTDRRLEINWYNIDNQPGDAVAIYDSDPSSPFSAPYLEWALVADLVEGFFKSRVRFPKIQFSETNLTAECLGFWAAYLREGTKLLAVTCLRARPFWMQEHFDDIKNSNLTSLMLPGTHDSGSYQDYQGRKSENVISRYMYAQEEDIFNQLAYGIRYLDIRVGHYIAWKDKFFINHSVFRTQNTLLRVLNDVKRFIEATTQEVVIVDFHRFPVGFEMAPDKVHTELLTLIEETLKDHLLPNNYSYSVTVSEIVQSGKRIILTYNDKHRIGRKLIWPEVRQYWGNQQNLNGLKKYFSMVYNRPTPGVFWAAMAELTPTPASIVLQPKEGLRVLADLTNRNVSRWYRNDHWSQKSNVVASDYFLANEVIDLAIDSNMRKATCPRR